MPYFRLKYTDIISVALLTESAKAIKILSYLTCGKLYPSPGYCGEIIWMYAATGLTYGEQHPDDDEFLSVEKIPLDKAVDMILNGEITDAKTQAAVLKLKILKDNNKI